MALQLTITSEHRDMPAEDRVREFTGDGGSIGRSLKNDWVLPDPDRFISGKHAMVDYRKGAWYLVDVSSNGVYINDESTPVGRGNPRRLFDGDRLRMGDFEFAVNIAEGEELEPAPALSLVPEEFGAPVAEVPARTGVELLDEEAITGDDEFQALIFGDGETMPTGARALPGEEEARPAARSHAADKPAGEPRAAPPDDVDADALLTEFLAGLGVDRQDLHPSVDPREVMRNAGRVMRALVHGMTELLECRANVKSMFQLDRTTVLPHQNNPLKLSRSVADSVKQLLVGKDGEYLGPLDSVKEICRDLKFHHDAMVEAMTAAVVDFGERFDPAELEASFNDLKDTQTLLDKLGKMKYWKLYCEIHPELMQPGYARLPQLFGEEFVRVYEKRLADLRRFECKGSSEAA